MKHLDIYPPYCLIFFLLLTQSHASNSQNSSCNPDDLRALEDFSNGLDSRIDAWKIPNNASFDECCNWVGVSCLLFPAPSSSYSDNSSALGLRVVGLDLSQMRLEGILSKSLSGLDHLSFLNLSYNSIRGPIPPELFYLQQLEILDLSSNSLSGELSEGIKNLSSLIHLDLSFNEFTGAIPDAFYNLRKLESFYARSNAFTGQLPVSLSACSMLKLLDLDDNFMDGRIHLDFTRLVHLTTLNLGSNQFRGHIPKSLSSCKSLKILNLPRNNLYGQIPRRFKQLQALSHLSLSNNSLSNISSALVTLQECRNLTTLVLTADFKGEEMSDYGIQGFQNLQVLVIANCALTGSIPSWLRGCNKLRLLDLSWNRFTGGIPLWFGGLDYLFYLDLSNNSLSGEIPLALTRLKSLISDSFLHSEEESTNDLPFFHKRQGNGCTLGYKRYSSFPPTLDLSDNMMNGSIWKEFGNLKLLHVFDLSRNNLSGPIPSELSGMSNLEKLDLSYNNLSGTIPSSLVRLTFLSSFSVAHNCLQGLIPSGGQFLTFPCSSFEGNDGLFGEFFFYCNSTPTPQPALYKDGENSDVDARIIVIGLPFWMGVIAGFFPTVFFLMTHWGYFRRPDRER